MLDFVEGKVGGAVTGVTTNKDTVRNVQDRTQLDYNHVLHESTRHSSTKRPRLKKPFKKHKNKLLSGEVGPHSESARSRSVGVFFLVAFYV